MKITAKELEIFFTSDGLEPVLIGLAATKSVKEHRPVKISEIRK